MTVLPDCMKRHAKKPEWIWKQMNDYVLCVCKSWFSRTFFVCCVCQADSLKIDIYVVAPYALAVNGKNVGGSCRYAAHDGQGLCL
jgi:hypothetical protein